MIRQFSADQGARFALYCYFPDRPPGQIIRLTREELESSLGSLSDSYTSELKDWFIKSFEVIFAPDFIAQFRSVLDHLKSVLRARNEAEALCWHAVIHGHLRDVILGRPPGERKVSLDDLRDLVHDARAAVFEASYAQVCGHEKYLKLLREQYKSRTANVPNRERLFVIECDDRVHILDLVEIVTCLRDRYHVGDSPPPYIAFRGEVNLTHLKHALWQERIYFHDGFDYGGADFNPDSLVSPPLPGYGVKLVEFKHLAELSGCVRIHEVHDFYLRNPATEFFSEARARHAVVEAPSDLRVILGGKHGRGKR
ncbi:hypothetical protein GCM10018793_25800 [Streptomyces sulfonofaciens]|uniref:Uncharacterized protein n=2 Tax=Streptomyces sulfonofaciens TaxID=68272 RepID=A0A919G4S2_9ACTN|nr:hypothetical protein GCM10018793_25800 [Streptomyces sulfonofaciens]